MMKVTLTTRDDVDLTFDCTETQDVLTAAETAGYYPPSMCRDGQCGMCSAHVVSGQYSMDSYNPQALPIVPESVLLCRCQPKSDLALRLSCTNAQISRQRIPERTATVISAVPVAAATILLSLELAEHAELGKSVDFIPGQYMELGIPELGVRRAYSPVNLPNWEGRLDFLIRIVADGQFSGWLIKSARPGNQLSVRGPIGHFILDEASTRPRVFVAGGCGFAPVLSMLRHMAEFQDLNPAHLIYAANTTEELLPASLLTELSSALPQLGVTISIWHPEPAWKGVTGTAAEALAAHLMQSDIVPDIYVCGPPRMLETVEAIAYTHGVPPDQFHAERLPGLPPGHTPK